MRGHKPPLKLVSSCKNSPWFSECIREAEVANDIALLYRLDNRAAVTFRSLGLTTVQQIAEMNLARLPRIPYMSKTALERVQLQAQSLQTHELRWLAKPTIPTAPIQIYFDIEGDPLLQVQYLFGFWIVHCNAIKLSLLVFYVPAEVKEQHSLFALQTLTVAVSFQYTSIQVLSERYPLRRNCLFVSRT